MDYMPELMFNIDCGYLEGLVRGFKSGILTRTDYLNLIQCETLEGMRNNFNCIFISNFQTRRPRRIAQELKIKLIRMLMKILDTGPVGAIAVMYLSINRRPTPIDYIPFDSSQ